MHTKTSDTKQFSPSESCSPRSHADNSTPNTGFMNPNTATLDTGLYLSRIPQREYATADTKASHNSIPTAAPLSNPDTFPPASNPHTDMIIPPNTNWYPLSITGFSVFENLFKYTDENA